MSVNTNFSDYIFKYGLEFSDGSPEGTYFVEVTIYPNGDPLIEAYEHQTDIDQSVTDNRALILGLLKRYFYDEITLRALSNVSIDLSPVINKLDTLDAKADSIYAKVEDIYDTVSSLPAQLQSLSALALTSLNGSYGTYKDGTNVSVKGLDGIWIVDGSFFMKNDETQFLVVYKLRHSQDNSRIIYSPSIFCDLAST